MLNYLKQWMVVAMFSSIALGSFANAEAPVYDADNPPPSFDGQPYDAGKNSSQRAPAPSINLTLEQRIDRVEQQVENLQHSDDSAKLNQLHAELQSVHGQLDELSHQLQVLQAQQKSMYSDLDHRITKQQSSNKTPAPLIAKDDYDDDMIASLPSAKPKRVAATPAKAALPVAVSSAAAPAAETAANHPQPDAAEEQQTYQVAYDLIKSKKYNEAVAALQKMLQKYPSGQFAANAHYWLGELYGLMGKNNESATEFANVVSAYPNSPKVSDAQLKLGLIYAAQFKWTEAKAAFRKVISHYPKTASARLASEQLKQIKQAGH